MQRSLERVLLPHFHLTFTDSGPALLQQAVAEPPDLILLEALLPGMDGFQIIRALRSETCTSQVPVIMFSWLLAEDRALQAGADAFVPKPLRAERLLSVIHRLLAPPSGDT